MPRTQILFRDDEWELGRLDEVADPLDDALMDAGVGEVVGGGIGRGVTRIELELIDEAAGLALVRRFLATLGAPASTRLRLADGREEAL